MNPDNFIETRSQVSESTCLQTRLHHLLPWIYAKILYCFEHEKVLTVSKSQTLKTKRLKLIYLFQIDTCHLFRSHATAVNIRNVHH